MKDRESKFNRSVSRFFNTITSIVKGVWNTTETCGFCCGIRFDREKRDNNMPTPSSCCGVRV